MQPRILSLFSGYGGLDMAVQEVFGGELVAVADIDSGPCKILAHRHPDVPNLGDVSTVDWTTIHADIICGGSPCQDLSTAGRRAGMTDGTRSNLWVMMREAVATIRPTHVVWENVRGAFSARADSAMESDPRLLGDHPAGIPALRALGRVLGDLADLGYDAQWCGLPASGVGAPHGRFRAFLLATDATGERGGEGDDAARLGARMPGASAVLGERDWQAAANADQPRLEGQQGQAGAAQAGRHGHALAGAGGPDLTLLPTPTATPYGSNQPMSPGAAVRPSLDGIIQLLPTPTSNLGSNGGPQDPGKRRAGGHSVSIEDAVHGLTTYTKTEGGHDPEKGRSSEVLRGMRGPAGEEALRERATGGSNSFPASPALLSVVRKQQAEGSSGFAQMARSPGKAKGEVREVRVNAGAACSPHRPRRDEQRPREPGGLVRIMPPDAALERGSSRSHGFNFGRYEAAIQRWEAVFGREAPIPAIPSQRTGKQQLNPEFCSWMMGLPTGWITDVPGITRNEALKACGNGVVPQQAIAALRHMLAQQAVAA